MKTKNTRVFLSFLGIFLITGLIVSCSEDKDEQDPDNVASCEGCHTN